MFVIARAARSIFLLFLAILLTDRGLGQASVLSDLVEPMQVGEWKEVSANINYTFSLIDAGGGRSIQAWCGKGTWDPVGKRIHFTGQGHIQNEKYIQYDEANNKWSIIDLNSTPWFASFGHCYQHNALDWQGGRYFYRAYNTNRVYAYPLRSNGDWTPLPTAPTGSGDQCCGALSWFPEWEGTGGQDQGGLALLEYKDLYVLEAGSNNWFKVDLSGVNLDVLGDRDQFMQYDPVHQLVLFGGGRTERGLYVLDRTGSVTQMQNAPHSAWHTSSHVTIVDPVSGELLVADGPNGVMRGYDVITDTWRVISLSRPLSQTLLGAGQNDPTQLHEVIGIPLSTHGAILYLVGEGSSGFAKAWLYKHAEMSSDTTAPLNPTGLVAQ